MNTYDSFKPGNGKLGLMLFETPRTYICDICRQPGVAESRTRRVHPGECERERDRRSAQKSIKRLKAARERNKLA